VDTESIEEHIDGVRSGDRTRLARAITLVESTRPDHRATAYQLLTRLLADRPQAQRVGITGVPGVGKSTFIESLGTSLTAAGHRVAVLTVDPTSSRTGGSILGDKTRMPELAVDPAAFIRPSPSSGTLGGVTATTRETMVLVEAAGYDVVLVETVGVGQSETMVADMVDTFCVLMLSGAGDELQGIKKGVLELADLVAVNKADGDNAVRARAAARDYATALHMVTPQSPSWTVPVIAVSALTGDGVDEFWTLVQAHQQALMGSGELDEKRRRQRVGWFHSLVHEGVVRRFSQDPATAEAFSELEDEVASGSTVATVAARQLLDRLG